MRSVTKVGLVLRVAVGTLLALLTVEVAARGYAYLPAGDGTKTWHREGNASSRWRDGIRLPISQGAHRILVLGDSYTAALHVADDETFCFLTERSLRRAGIEAAVLNAGTPAHGLPDHISRGRALASKTRASWTLVVLNDDDFEASTWSKANTHFVAGPNGLTVEPPRQPALDRFDRLLKPLQGRSAAVQNAFLQYKGLRQMTAAWRPFRAEGPAQKAPPKRRYPVAEELALAREVLGERVTFVHLGVGTSDVTPTEAQFRQACEAQRLSCVTTRERLAALRRRGIPPQGFPNSGWDTGHLSRWGHQEVAQAIAGALSHGLL